MKKITTLKVGDKEYQLMFTMRALAAVEQDIGESLLFILGNPLNAVRKLTISVVAAGIRHGLVDGKDKDPYDVLDEIIENGGSIDETAAVILQAWRDSGLFTKPVTESKKAPETGNR